MKKQTVNAKPVLAYDQRTPDSEIACHVFANGAWHGLSLDDALTLAKKRTKRCEDCDGEVRVMREGPGSPAHAEHVHRHEGCPRSDVWKNGPKIRSRHFNPVN